MNGFMKVHLGDIYSRLDLAYPMLGYSKEWVCADFNPTGIRECSYIYGVGWQSAKYAYSGDCYITDTTTAPTHVLPYTDLKEHIPL